MVIRIYKNAAYAMDNGLHDIEHTVVDIAGDGVGRRGQRRGRKSHSSLRLFFLCLRPWIFFHGAWTRLNLLLRFSFDAFFSPRLCYYLVFIEGFPLFLVMQLREKN